VPYTRGREVSRSSASILEEVSRLADTGYRTITLLGQNVNSYGRERRGDAPSRECSFAALLERIGRICDGADQSIWVYFTSPHPRDMSPDVLEAIAGHRSLACQIHLPLQSGDDDVLKRMNRGYDVDRYREVVAEVRHILPSASLFTDIIVGFPGETDAQFEHSREAMREFRFNMAYIAMYSPRSGTRSAEWRDDVPFAEKKRRLHELSGELKTTSLALNRDLVGSVVPVLVTGEDRRPGFLAGRTEGRIVVRLPDPRPDLAHAEAELIGTIVPMQVTGAAALSVEGEAVLPVPTP
jgi:tRNA-2-methylthio-N6-dimethylallyladenosine synthase